MWFEYVIIKSTNKTIMFQGNPNNRVEALNAVAAINKVIAKYKMSVFVADQTANNNIIIYHDQVVNVYVRQAP